MFSRSLVSLLTAIWSLSVLSGMGWLSAYQQRSEPVDLSALTWPAGTILVRSLEKPTLLMFLHPQCPCSRAGLEQLAQVVADFGPQCQIQVVLLLPSDAEASWWETKVARFAASLPEVKTVGDVGAVEARRFGAAVSGQTMLYDRHGQLLFSGGITGGRGHVGRNRFEDQLRQLLAESRALPQVQGAATTPVFGCRLWSADSQPLPERQR